MYKKWKTELFVRDIFLSHIQVWLIRASEPDIYSVILCQDPFQLRRGAEKQWEEKLLSPAEYKQFENTDVGQALHLHNYIVNG